MEKTIFIVKEEKSFNYNGLYRFGTNIVPVRKFDIKKNSTDSARDKLGIEKVLRDFNYKEDYLMLSGCPITTFACGAILAANVPYVNTLTWDNRNKLYVPGRWDF